MVTVAAMPNTVVMDMARRMLIMLFSDIKLEPLTNVKITKQSTSVMMAAQSSRKRNTFLLAWLPGAVLPKDACMVDLLPLFHSLTSGYGNAWWGIAALRRGLYAYCVRLPTA